MNEVTTFNSGQLPDTIEDLSRFVLVNEERVQALRAEIRAIKKVSLAKEVYEQKLAEAQEIGKVTVEAAQKIGELLLQIEKQSGRRTDITSVNNLTEVKTKTQVTEEMGLTHHQVIEYQQMADNPEAVQAAIDKAIERGDVVSRSQVMKEIRSLKEQITNKERRIIELESREPEVRVERPADYEQLKKKAKEADAWKQDYHRQQEKTGEALRKNLELQEQVKKLQEQTVREQLNNDFVAGALYFIAQCGNFIKDVAGYVWIADKLADLPEKDRTGYVKAAKAVQDWSTALLQAIERDKEYGRPEILRITNQG